LGFEVHALTQSPFFTADVVITETGLIIFSTPD